MSVVCHPEEILLAHRKCLCQSARQFTQVVRRPVGIKAASRVWAGIAEAVAGDGSGIVHEPI